MLSNEERASARAAKAVQADVKAALVVCREVFGEGGFQNIDEVRRDVLQVAQAIGEERRGRVANAALDGIDNELNTLRQQLVSAVSDQDTRDHLGAIAEAVGELHGLVSGTEAARDIAEAIDELRKAVDAAGNS